MPLLDMADNTLRPGQTVWAEGVVGFPDEVMLAEVVPAPYESEGFIEFARHGRVSVAECVWIRQRPTAAVPIAKGTDPWLTRWPARKVLGV